MTKTTSAVTVKIRECNYDRILADLIEKSATYVDPCTTWAIPWANANWEWVYGARYNFAARQLVEEVIAGQSTSTVTEQAAAAYAACLAGNPLTPPAPKGIEVRVNTSHKGKTTSATTTALSSKSRPTAQVSVSFSPNNTDPDDGDDDEPTDCPPVPREVFLEDAFTVTWFPYGNDNYLLEIYGEFYDGDKVTPEYQDYLCLHPSITPNQLWGMLDFSVAQLYEIVRAAIQTPTIPSGITLTDYESSSSSSDDFSATGYRIGAESHFEAVFVTEYINTLTEEVVWHYSDLSSVFEADVSNVLLYPTNTDGPIGVKGFQHIIYNALKIPTWGSWTIRVKCIHLRMRLDKYPNGILITADNLLMSSYALRDGSFSGRPAWYLTDSLGVYVPGETTGLVTYERSGVKIARPGIDYSCKVEHMRIISGIGAMYTISFTNNTTFDFWFRYSFTGNVFGAPLTLHSPPASTVKYYVFMAMNSIIQSDVPGVLNDVDFITNTDGSYVVTTAPFGMDFNYTMNPSTISGILQDIRDGDNGITQSLGYVPANDLPANVLPYWAAPTVDSTGVIVGYKEPCAIHQVDSTYQKIGPDYVIYVLAMCTYEQPPDYPPEVVNRSREFTWAEINSVLGVPGDMIKVAIDGQSYRVILNSVPFTLRDYAMVINCDYWSSLADLKSKVLDYVTQIMESELPEYYTLNSIDDFNPYVEFRVFGTYLTDVPYLAGNGIVPSISTTSYPSKMTVRI